MFVPVFLEFREELRVYFLKILELIKHDYNFFLDFKDNIKEIIPAIQPGPEIHYLFKRTFQVL